MMNPGIDAYNPTNANFSNDKPVVIQKYNSGINMGAAGPTG